VQPIAKSVEGRKDAPGQERWVTKVDFKQPFERERRKAEQQRWLQIRWRSLLERSLVGLSQLERSQLEHQPFPRRQQRAWVDGWQPLAFDQRRGRLGRR
jgi:hypothetical protein